MERNLRELRKMNKKVSIILPVYNCEKYVAKTLDALICQTYKNIEILCINDGSTDNSIKILEEYKSKDNRIKIFTQGNSGPAKARNTGLDNSTGEYIMFCDSDDTYEEQMCEKMVKSIEEHNVDLVMCKANLTFDEGIYRQASANVMTNLMPIGFNKIENIKPKELSVLLWHKIFKKSIIDKYAMRFPDGLEWDDSLFCYEYYSVINNYWGLDDKLYNYLVRNNSIMDIYLTKKNPDKNYDKLRIFTHFYNFLQKNNLEKTKKYFYHTLLTHNFILCFNLFDTQEEKAKAIEYFLKNIKTKKLVKKYKKFTVKDFENLVKTNSIEEILGKRQFLVKKIIKFVTMYLKYYKI